MRRLLALTLLVPALLPAQAKDSVARAAECRSCAAWNVPHAPFRVHGNTWYVGTDGLTALLITSGNGHVLVDGGLEESAERIMANVRTLGFRMEDVKLIVNSHAHHDHAGGIAALQRASGARVAAHSWSAAFMRTGRTMRSDPQYLDGIDYPAVDSVQAIRLGGTLQAGEVTLRSHATGGHTPGGTSWSWRSCEGSRCVDIVYADSQTPVSSDPFLYTRDTVYTTGVQDFERGLRTIASLKCDILVTPHPSASQLFERLAKREAGDANAMIDPTACRRFAEAGRKRLAERVAREKAAGR